MRIYYMHATRTGEGSTANPATAGRAGNKGENVSKNSKKKNAAKVQSNGSGIVQVSGPADDPAVVDAIKDHIVEHLNAAKEATQEAVVKQYGKPSPFNKKVGAKKPAVEIVNANPELEPAVGHPAERQANADETVAAEQNEKLAVEPAPKAPRTAPIRKSWEDSGEPGTVRFRIRGIIRDAVIELGGAFPVPDCGSDKFGSGVSCRYELPNAEMLLSFVSAYEVALAQAEATKHQHLATIKKHLDWFRAEATKHNLTVAA